MGVTTTGAILGYTVIYGAVAAYWLTTASPHVGPTERLGWGALAIALCWGAELLLIR